MKATHHLLSGILPFILLSACNDAINYENTSVFSDVQFTVSASSEQVDGAHLTILHDGTDRDTYYGFTTRDLETSLDAAVNQKLKELSEKQFDPAEVVKNGAMRSMNVTGLESGKTYRYVVFGLNQDGTTYGRPGSCAFTTLKGAPVHTVNLVGNPTATSVIVTVGTTGDNTDRWYCFVTTDMETPLGKLCEAQLASVNDLQSFLESGHATKEFSDLHQNKKYRAVVTGVKDGTVYGTPSSVEFKTQRLPVIPSVNSAWTITNEGAGALEINGQTTPFKQIISCQSISDERYFMTVVSEKDMRKYVDKMDAFLIDAADYMTRYLEDFNRKNGTNFTWLDISYAKSAREGFNMTKAGTYHAYAIGIDPGGSPTGKYAVSEPFIVEEAPVSETMKPWLGSWRIGDGKVDYDVTIESAVEQGETLVHIYGWEGEQVAAFPFVGMLDPETGGLFFIACELANVTLVDNGQRIDCVLGFYGSNGPDVYMSGADNAYNIALARFTSEAKTAAKADAQAIQTQNGDLYAQSLGYYAKSKADGAVYNFAQKYPILPLHLQKTAATPAMTMALAQRSACSGKEFRLHVLRNDRNAFSIPFPGDSGRFVTRSTQ